MSVWGKLSQWLWGKLSHTNKHKEHAQKTLWYCNLFVIASPSHRVDQVVDCGLWNVGPLLFNGCAKLLDIGRNWNTLSYKPIQSIPNMLNGWHVRRVCWPCKNWDVFSFQELCTDPCNMGPCIIMLQHEVMVVDEWHNNGPQDLVMVSLCIQNAINKMHLCSLSITYACPYHNPNATMGHSIHNVDISKPLTHTTPYKLSAICPVQWKPGFIREENTSPKCRCHRMWAFAHTISYDDELQSGRDLDEDDEHADELPWDGFWQIVQKLFGYANRLLQQLSGWLVSDDLGGEDARCGGPGLVWLHVVCGCEAGWMYCQILWNAFGDG